MQKRRSRLILGAVLILAGALLLYLGSAKQVELVINGRGSVITTRASRVESVLRQAGITQSPTDRIRPGLTDRVKDGQRITLDRAAAIRLTAKGFSEPLRFTSYQRFGGNILLDAGLRLYPGDRLLWNGTEIRPDFDLSGASDLDLRLESADGFTLITDSFPAGITAHGSGATVNDALISAGVDLTNNVKVFPDGTTPFTPGMTAAVLPFRELTISRNGSLIRAVSCGTNVGEALARAGIPLMGSDVSIPAASEPVPADGRILIVPVSDSFSMKARSIPRETEWSANAELDLDEVRLTASGSDGLKGTFTRKRTENGETVLNETSPEAVLVQPVPDRKEYGTKITIRTLDTPDGPLEYYRSVQVYATAYSPCRSGVSGCITGTASGMKVAKGVVAVTSSWYNKFSGQSVYVPDYGKGVIADVGGGIPGRRWIDLAYSDDDFVGWSRDTTLYFLTPVPADMVWVLQ